MSRTPDTNESPKPVAVLYKEEGDTRTRCGPVFTRMSDGGLRNYRDAASEPRLKADGRPYAAWFRLSQARKIARELRLPLELL